MVVRQLKKNSTARNPANILAVMAYAAFLLLDARVLAELWAAMVTASFAIAGTALLLISRKSDDKVQRVAGGATLALVIFRLFYVDLAGVDTIWRVLLFLGCGALFLFASRQLGNSSVAQVPEGQ